MTSVLHLPIMAEGHAPNLRSGPAWWDRAALESGRTALVGAIVSARRRGDRLVHTEDAEPGRPIGRIASLRVEERREGAVLMARVQFTAKPEKPDPVYAHKLQELIGGAFGEMTVTMQYLFQGWNCRVPGKYKDLIMDTATSRCSPPWSAASWRGHRPRRRSSSTGFSLGQ